MLAGSGINWTGLEIVATPLLAGRNIGQIITPLLPYIFSIAGIVMLFYLIYSGYQWMMSADNPKTLEQARKNMQYAIIGFLVIFISYWLVALIGRIFDLQPIVQMFH